MNRDVRIEMPYEAEWIIKKIRERGFEAFAVGGCVRDTLLGRTPGDWDITTSAKPEEVKAIFGKTVDTGLQHGTVTIIKNRKGYEVTGRTPGDWDITTSAKPEEVKAIFGKTVDTGLQHGTVTIIKNRKGYEVTTYRIDGEYRDGRHPDSVEFTSSLLEDLKRREPTASTESTGTAVTRILWNSHPAFWRI